MSVPNLLMGLAASVILGLLVLTVTLLIGPEPVDGRALAAVIVGSISVAAAATLLAALLDRSGGSR